jgi:hypothetical protein
MHNEDVASNEDRQQWLRESLADHRAYWDSQNPLTRAQMRWKAFEESFRRNLVAQAETRADVMPNPRIVDEVRSGQWEQRQRRNLENMLRSRARLAQLRRDGYTFDAEHRLVAPRALPRPATRRRECRPQRLGSVARSTRSTRGSPAREPDEPEPAPRGLTPAELDRFLDIRERLVYAIDELDADDPGSARWYLAGLLEDLDAVVEGAL